MTKQLALEGALLLEGDIFSDTRGTFCSFWEEGARPSLNRPFSAKSFLLSKNSRRHTLRGMHFQHPPHEQSKLVSCVRGAAHDVILDLRPTSSTFRKWHSICLDSVTPQALYIPPGCAHGFLTLEADTWITYLIEGPYVPGSGGVVRWNDPLFGIHWPASNPILSDKDRFAADYQP